jgi:hypothetical protein
VNMINQTRTQMRFGASPLTITEAFDEQGEHSSTSRHYEGRALDIPAEANKVRKLAGLALLAGFDWVWVEPNATGGGYHLHVSHSGSSTTVSPATILGALSFGRQSGLIRSQQVFQSLSSKMSLVESLTQSINSGQLSGSQLTAAKQNRQNTFNSFISQVNSGIANGSISNTKLPSNRPNSFPDQWAKFGELLLTNAGFLRF